MMKRRYLQFIFVAGLILAASLYYVYLHHFAVVIPGEVYRSPQLSKTEFTQVITTYHLKSILNLRGVQRGQVWYDDEIAVAKAMSVNHYDIELWSTNLPDVSQLKQLVAMIDTAPRPLLVHCEGGADRSGLASAIALLLADEKSLEKIRAQTSLKYFVIKEDSVGKQFIHLYETWLAQQHLTTSRANFLKWIDQLKPGVNYPVH